MNKEKLKSWALKPRTLPKEYWEATSPSRIFWEKILREIGEKKINLKEDNIDELDLVDLEDDE